MAEAKTIKSTKLDSIESKFPLIKGEELGKMRLCEFGVCADGVKRSCAKIEAKAGFHWTECMPASKGGPMPEGVTCCPKNHFGFLASGKMKIMMVETGEEQIISAGEAYYVPPKHDAIMLEDTVMLEFESTAAEYYGKLDNDAS
ncbi:hypothetical protein ACHAWC_011838 [Mediolabrus comicus]|eukprot:scaffold25594_cov69-Skeletonema_menzelii.AAC.2